MTKIKRLPYGISDFKQLRREEKYYVDKTMFLPLLEETDNFLFLVRPRRFGKSIFLSMIKSYYDVNEKDSFTSLFGELWIANRPTPARGTFQVLHLDFSRVVSDMNKLEVNFDDYCCLMLDNFMDRYAHFYEAGYAERGHQLKHYPSKFNYIDNKAKEAGYPLYLIVDEYDNFTNSVLNVQGESVYHSLTHGEGFYRDVFKLFKGMFSRILMMGVSPVTLDDVTSGYNIATNITMNPLFNVMLGFSEEDVRQIILYYRSVGLLNRGVEDLIAEMKPWYDNYCFAQESLDTDPKMFNCDMVCYYLNMVMQTGRSPREMVDPNTRTDYNKMRRLIQLDRLDGNRRGILHQITQDGYVYGSLAQSFPAENLTDEKNFISLLFYYGMLTIGGTYGARLKLVIPNNNVRRQYYNYLMEEYQEIARIDISRLSESFDLAALEGDWQSMVHEIADIYERTTSVRQLIEGERNLQGFMNAYLTLNPYYLTAPEVELNHGYCDFFLMPDLSHYPMVAHSYIIELKYLKRDDTEETATEQWEAAVEQIRQYAQAPMVRQLVGQTRLHLLIIQIRGYELQRADEV